MISKTKREFYCFHRKIDVLRANLNPFWMNLGGNRIARAIELWSTSKIIRYKKQTRILLFFRRNLTNSIGAELKTRIHSIYFTFYNKIIDVGRSLILIICHRLQYLKLQKKKISKGIEAPLARLENDQNLFFQCTFCI